MRFHNKWIWAVLIVLVNWLGPLAYFAVGRIDVPLPDDSGAGERPPPNARRGPSSCSTDRRAAVSDTARRRAASSAPARHVAHARRAAAPTPPAAASTPAVPAAVELRGLTKRYGRKAALDGVELTVPVGAIFGFLGPNGAGKTTTLRILGGLARPTAGSALVLGHDVLTAGNEVRSLDRLSARRAGLLQVDDGGRVPAASPAACSAWTRRRCERGSRPCSTSPVWPASKPASAPTRGA